MEKVFAMNDSADIGKACLAESYLRELVKSNE
jgi:hypothetical protein